MSVDTLTPIDPKIKAELAQSLWRVMRDAPESETVEARKAVWENEKAGFKRNAGALLRRLEAKGLRIVQSDV